MSRRNFKFVFFVLCLFSFNAAVAKEFTIVSKTTETCIVYDAKGSKLDSIAAYLLQQDIKMVSGYVAPVYNNLNKANGNCIIIGQINSALLKSLTQGKNGTLVQLEGKWECYGYKVVSKPTARINQALIIAGSDSRGTAYGVFSLSEQIGVNPWYWWADVKPPSKASISLNVIETVSAPPSVKYRGIFINDEDWGLQPWAAKTFEPETGDIGPKTYAKLFELLLRLKANLIWPAMHPSTKAFYSYPGNKKIAADYDIVVGSSHAEPMLRNNVGEWNEKTMGHFNYITNKQQVYNYWESRVKESSTNQAIYTMGMRGVHDSGMEGVKGPKEAVPLLEQIIADQRGLFQKYINPDATKVPQVFTAYKEVLDVYDNGLKVPEDITLVWPDDNYGYIQRLSNPQERKRKGGSGVYYHASYWGRPHDYLWLSTTHPALIREEMTKAYELDARNVWVINVGDIKPSEYNIQLFMDMAYQIKPFQNSAYSKMHLTNWAGKIFGDANAAAIGSLMWQYYNLAFERKPEFMGWSQTEPTTPVNMTAYNHYQYGDQAQRRINSYAALESNARSIKSLIKEDQQDAFYELVYYPVVGSSLMNKKFLYRDKALLYAGEGRLSAENYAQLSDSAYKEIAKETRYYNEKLANGKWANIMSMKPRDLPVYQEPKLEVNVKQQPVSWQVRPEGYAIKDSLYNLILPTFSQAAAQPYFLDVYLCKPEALDFTITASQKWIRVSKQTGKLLPDGSQSQQRIWVSIDWDSVPKDGKLQGQVVVNAGNRSVSIAVEALRNQLTADYKANGYISMNAADYSAKTNSVSKSWTVIEGLGYAGKSLQAVPFTAAVPDTSASAIKNNPSVTYDFYTQASKPAEVKVYTLPTFPVNNSFGMRYAVSVDDGPLTILNFKTVGRSNEWKQNVLSNTTMRSVKLSALPAGKHQLKIYMIDPGVVLNRIIIDFGGLKPFYGKL
ncbi:glycosyl hydrolase 115 family protein [Mucilaginibacter galii]|uniref:Gylcosyl hydrolase 115 C-terminal domain-containing protein n=1 Tax=Mucilaginibacter galii TaxID=2005073 RepID=A0A917JA27_9SPHI|nr:glycosyl hydrolase 115 family protein [Mucilaginibacter galii]GGI50760.1 hypothetical protein GCM10011425_19720 [Mucilaginibacter galii]